MTEPLESEADARALPEIRDAFEAARSDRGNRGTLQAHGRDMLEAPFADLGVPVSGYETRLLHWLAGSEVHICAVFARLFLRFWRAGYEAGKAERDD